jgi:methylenetetrahydrofolate reductase (NADPH)
VEVLPKKLDEEVAAHMVAGFGGVMTRLTEEQADYIHVPVEGPFKSETITSTEDAMSSRPDISFEYFPPKTPAGRDKLLGDHAGALQELNAGVLFRDLRCRWLNPRQYPGHGDGTQGAGRRGRAAPQLRPRRRGDDRRPPRHLPRCGHPPPRGPARRPAVGHRQRRALVYANELVAFIREHTGDHFHIEVAAYPEIHPQAESYDSDLGYLKGKFDAGADSAITQYFYNVDAYSYFLDRCAAIGIDKPIYAGIMPITNYANLARFSRNCGAEIPRWICQRLESFADDHGEHPRLRHRGGHAQLCETLLERGARGSTSTP